MHYCRLLFHSSKYSQNMLISPEAQIAGELNFEKELYHVIIYFLFLRSLKFLKQHRLFLPQWAISVFACVVTSYK